MRRLDRLRADGRKIRAQFLAGLGAFDQNAAGLPRHTAVATQQPCPVEQSVGPLDAFQRDDPAADRNRRLADIQRPDGLRRGERRLDVAPVDFRGTALVSDALGGDQVRDDLVGADDLIPRASRPAPRPSAGRRRRAPAP